MTEAHKSAEQCGWWKRNWPCVASLAAIAVVGGIFALPFLLIHGDEVRCKAREQECGLYSSDRVKSVLDGTPGMVTAAYCGQLEVRFSANAHRTDTHLLGSDGAISREPYAKVWMRCYEVASD